MLDRRKEQRKVSTFKSAYVRAASGLHFVTLRNVSESGICFDAYPGVAVGDAIEFCFDSNGAKTGMVKWVENGRFGVQADYGYDLSDGQFDPLPARSVRLPLSSTANLFLHGQRIAVAVHNLSTRGTCIDSVPGLEPGELVSINMGDRSFEVATVRWIAGKHAGICFAETVHRAEFRALVDRLQARQPYAAHTGEKPLHSAELLASSATQCALTSMTVGQGSEAAIAANREPS